VYGTPDFDRLIALKARTEAIARNLTDFLKKSDRFAKTIVFCVDQEHAEEMRRALNNCNADLVKQYPDYVARVVSDEGDIGRSHLGRFMELETTTPAILTTSQMLTTGVDVPTCKNVVIVRTINSMTEFKQIIGRGTRVRDDYGKLFFNILDYTGSATRLFADPDFDGDPVQVTEEQMDATGETIGEPTVVEEQAPVELDELPPGTGLTFDDEATPPRKYYVDAGVVEIAAHLVYELDADGRRLQVKKFTEYTAESVRSMYPSAAELRTKWSNAAERAAIIETLEAKGISFEELAEASKQPDADPFDLLCHVAYSAPIRSRRERAETARNGGKAFFDKYTNGARDVLNELLEKYVEFGTAQFQIPDILKVPPISQHGNVIEIANLFGGPDQLRQAVGELQQLLYAP
jgi:type I restriction enzyme R subunit